MSTRKISANFRIVCLLLAASLVGACSAPGNEQAGETSTSAVLATTTTGAARATSTATTPTSTDGGEGSTESGLRPLPDGLEGTTIRMAFQEPAITAVTFEKWRRDLVEAGMTVESVEFEGADAVLRALIVDEVDLVSLPPLPLLLYVKETGRAEFKMIVASRKTTDYLLAVTPEITDVEQLAGGEKIWAISTPGDVSDTFSRYILQQIGIDPSTVNFVQIGGTSARVAALLSDSIAAGALHSTDAYVVEETGEVDILLRYGDYMGDYLQPAIVASDSFLESKPVLAQYLVDTYMDSVRWAIDQPEEFTELAVEWLTAEGSGDADQEAMRGYVEKALRLFDETGVWALNGGLQEEIIDATIQIERELGYLEDPVPDTSEWLDRSYVEDYLAREGTR